MRLSKQILPQACKDIYNDSALVENPRIYHSIQNSTVQSICSMNSYWIEKEEHLRNVTDSNL